MKGKKAYFKLSSMTKNFTDHLLTAERLCYFNDELTVIQTDHIDDVEVTAESIVSLLALSRRIKFYDGSNSIHSEYYSIKSNASDDKAITLSLNSYRSEFLSKLGKCLLQKLKNKNSSIL